MPKKSTSSSKTQSITVQMQRYATRSTSSLKGGRKMPDGGGEMSLATSVSVSHLSTRSAHKQSYQNQPSIIQKYSMPTSAMKHTVRHLALDLSGYKPANQEPTLSQSSSAQQILGRNPKVSLFQDGGAERRECDS